MKSKNGTQVHRLLLDLRHVFQYYDTKVFSKETLHGYDRGLCILQFCASGSSIMILVTLASSGYV